ncbi:MAG: ribbon-helix-helix domain-containing protein [Candidatus ainarchaeum sp.]|nr:ribbon-helix-helix domain-containing protein [Candidatus ainarchaeum sp.]
MVTTMSFTAEEAFVRAIDNAIAKTGLYHSKSEFLRDAAREKLEKVLGLEEHIKAVEASRKRLQAKMKFLGYPSQEERDRMAREYLKSHSAKR